jgi:hypothetical protein
VQIFVARGTQRRDRVRAVCAIQNNFAERRRVCERADLRFAADRFQPFLTASLLAVREPIMI